MINTYTLAVIGMYGQRQTLKDKAGKDYKMTLALAERMQADMTLAGVSCFVVNLATDYDCSLQNKGQKVWQKFSLLTM